MVVHQNPILEEQLVAELEVPELLADRARDEAQLNLAKVEAGRVDVARTKAPDLITPDTVDEAVGKLKVAEADLARTDTLLGYARIRAPFDGIVTMRYVDPGAFIPAATVSTSAAAAAIVTVMDFSVVRTQVAVPEVEASLVAVGEPVRVSVTSLPGSVFTGAVSRCVYAIDQTTRTLLVEADLPNANLLLRPGMYASVDVGVEKHSGVLLVPVTAVIRERANSFVFMVANGTVERVQIKPGFADSQNVEVAGGLDPGAVVVLNGKLPLVAGQAVNPIESP